MVMVHTNQILQFYSGESRRESSALVVQLGYNLHNFLDLFYRVTSSSPRHSTIPVLNYRSRGHFSGQLTYSALQEVVELKKFRVSIFEDKSLWRFSIVRQGILRDEKAPMRFGLHGGEQASVMEPFGFVRFPVSTC